MNFLTRIFQSFTQTAPVIGCVLPPMVVRAKAVKQPEQRDLYEIDVQKNEKENAVSGVFGFNTAKAIIQNDGAVPDLTAFDIDELKSRRPTLWGLERTTKGRETNANNLKAKGVWSRGGSAKEMATATRNSESWAEKRRAAFEAALKEENNK